jgi:hypothetical protein
MNHTQKDPFSRSYGARLPSSLTRFLSRALVYSTFLPVSVLVRLLNNSLEAFLDSMASTNPCHPKGFTSPLLRHMFWWIYLPKLPMGLDHHFQPVAGLAFCVTPLFKHRTGSTGILSLLPITYAFRPRLRDRLTLGGRTFPRKP